MNEIERIFIIDIDGCILDNVFPKFDEKQLSLKEIILRLKNLKIYQEFFGFLYNIIKPTKDKLYFITGRYHKKLRKLTKKQLKIIKTIKYVDIDYEIYFFPKKVKMTNKNYFNFKYFRCKNIIDKNKDKIIYIFDDNIDYFIRLMKNYSDIRLMCFEIREQNSWYNLSILINELDEM